MHEQGTVGRVSAAGARMTRVRFTEREEEWLHLVAYVRGYRRWGLGLRGVGPSSRTSSVVRATEADRRSSPFPTRR